MDVHGDGAGGPDTDQLDDSHPTIRTYIGSARFAAAGDLAAFLLEQLNNRGALDVTVVDVQEADADHGPAVLLEITQDISGCGPDLSGGVPVGLHRRPARRTPPRRRPWHRHPTVLPGHPDFARPLRDWE